MKNITLNFVFFFFTSHLIFAQPAIEWQKSLGGLSDDMAYSIQQTTDGGYIIAGSSGSGDGDVTGNHGGGTDYWVVKINSSGGIEWQKSLGGTDYDYAYSVQQTADGGYIIAGSAESTDGDVTGNHGSPDYWVVKLSSTGNLLWQKSYGGTSLDEAGFIQQTIDGGYIVGGNSSSNNGDVTVNYGYQDIWVVKLSDSGNIQWQKTLGGSQIDGLWCIRQTTDKGYIVAGRSYSNDGDVTGHHGSTTYSDYWIVKLDSIGDIQWQKSLGGTSIDWAYSIQQTTDTGYIVAGGSGSIDGDVTGNHGAFDFWIVKLSNLGNIQWQKSLGGSHPERACSIIQTTDGGYISTGMTQSNDGDVSGNHGSEYSYDYWVVKLNSLGNLEWQKTLGGTSYDWAQSICETFDGGYVVAGYSGSADGDVTGHHGPADDNHDYWIVKLNPFYTEVFESNSKIKELKVYPNPGSDRFNLQLDQYLVGSTYSVMDLVGKTLLTGKVKGENSVIDISGLACGMYLVRVGNNGEQMIKIIKQ